MLFNSLSFLYFFLIVYGLYAVSNHRWQNTILLAGSYVFYGWWDWRFLSLIVFSTFLDYVCGIRIDEHTDPKIRRRYLAISMIGNLGVLGFFKYYNFFTESLQSILHGWGVTLSMPTMHVILPLGISFYTFQTMSYTIDIYYGRLKPTRHFGDFALFVTFFPQLVAGPIERAIHLLPQILQPRQLTIAKFKDGCQLILWGLFMKMFVADNMAAIVDPVFSANGPYDGLTVLLAAYAFAFQIFCDFAGYSNIARGLGLLMGFDIMVNFRLPYFAANPRDFWLRWHISLSGWLRDYLYIPMGGNRKGSWRTYQNLAVTMLLGGLWHGAAWNFVLWGAYHGALLVAHRLLIRLFKGWTVVEHRVFWLARVVVFFHLVCVGWIVFRSQHGMVQIAGMLRALFFNWRWHWNAGIRETVAHLVFFLGLLIAVQIGQYVRNDLMVMRRWPKYGKIAFNCALVLLLLLYGSRAGEEFIYFVF